MIGSLSRSYKPTEYPIHVNTPGLLHQGFTTHLMLGPYITFHRLSDPLAEVLSAQVPLHTLCSKTRKESEIFPIAL